MIHRPHLAATRALVAGATAGLALLGVAGNAAGASSTTTTTTAGPSSRLATLPLPSLPAPSLPTAALSPGTMPKVSLPHMPALTMPALPKTSLPRVSTPTLPSIGAVAVPGGTQPSTGAAYSSIASQYTTLSGALIGYYAKQQDQSLSSFMSRDGAQVATLLGTNGQKTPPLTNSLAALNKELSSSGMAVNPSAYNSLEAEAQAIDAHSSNIDAKVVAKASADVSALAALHAGKLAPAKLQVTPSSLAVGGLFDKSLANMVTNFPNIYAKVSSGSLASPSGVQAFDSSMTKALQQSQPNLNSQLPSSCIAQMLDVAASGSASGGGAAGSGCSGCVTAGMYLHNELSQLANPQAANPIPNASSSIIPPSELSGLPSWEANAIVKQNQSLSTQLNQSLNSGGGSCSTASAASTGALSSSLPGVFQNLQK